MSNGITWTEQEDKVLTDNYLKTKKIQSLEVLLPGRCYNAIKARANLLGMKRDIPYFKDEEFFTLPTEVNCAVAGFIAADGHIGKKDRVTIHLSTNDIDYLNQIKSIIKYKGPLYFGKARKQVVFKKNGREYLYDCTPQCSLSVYCSKWVQDLQRNWSITQRKTFTLQGPNISDIRHKLAFVSGVTDGDGWICEPKHDPKEMKEYSLSIMGNHEFMKWIKDIFDSISILKTRKAAELKFEGSGNIYSFKISGAKLYWFAKMFLSLDIIRLDRKWDKMKKLVNMVENDNNISQMRRTYLINTCPDDDAMRCFGLLDHKHRMLDQLQTKSRSKAAL